MATAVAVALLLGAMMGIVDYVTERLIIHRREVRMEIVSFSAGVAISYLLLRLLPEMYLGVDNLGQLLFLFLLLGFISVHLVEKYVYSHYRRYSLRRAHRTAHLSYFFIYNFLIGMLIYWFSSQDIIEGLFFFFPFLLYSIVEIIPKEFKFKNNQIQALYSFAPLYGVIIAIILQFAEVFYQGLIGFVAGALLYLIVREAIPPDKKGMPLYFISGVVMYSSLIIVLWFFT